MTDREAAQSAGLPPDSAAYTKSKPRVRAWMLQHRAFGNVNISAIGCKCGVERREGIALNIQVLSQVMFQGGWIRLQLFGQAVDRHPWRQLA